MKAKIFYLLECRECNHCVGTGLYVATCAETEKDIPDIESIPDTCELEDANEFIEWKKRRNNAS